jgi:hypothetical protein
MQMLFVNQSLNRKVGPIAVSYSSPETCPQACPLKASGCYSKAGPSLMAWKRTEDPAKSLSWPEFLARLRKVESGRLFRYGVAGDLPGIGDRLDIDLFKGLVKAARHLKGWCYTHKPLDTQEEREAIREANAAGWVTNLSADSLAEADRKAGLGVAPVVTLLPSDTPLAGSLRTPEGRKVVVCPAQTKPDVNCMSCRLCARTGTESKERVIVGFVAHGTRKKAADKVFYGS